MKSYSSREVIQILIANGWKESGKPTGSHHYFKHPDRPELGKITVQHPRKSFPVGTLKAISKQSGIKF